MRDEELNVDEARIGLSVVQEALRSQEKFRNQTKAREDADTILTLTMKMPELANDALQRLLESIDGLSMWSLQEDAFPACLGMATATQRIMDVMNMAATSDSFFMEMLDDE